MNKITDIVLSTQLSCVVAFVCTFWAHGIFAGNFLNHNWNPIAYVAVAIAVIFMLLPHIICKSEIIYPPYILTDETDATERHFMGCPTCHTGIYTNREPGIVEHCHNESVLDP